MRADARPTVLHLIDCLSPGGSEQQLLHLLRSTDRKRWRPLVGVFHEGGMLRGDVDRLGVPVLTFPLRSSLAHPNTLWQLVRIVALCKRERVAIVHAHDYYANLLGVAVAKLTGARSIVSRGDSGALAAPVAAARARARLPRRRPGGGQRARGRGGARPWALRSASALVDREQRRGRGRVRPRGPPGARTAGRSTGGRRSRGDHLRRQHEHA